MRYCRVGKRNLTVSALYLGRMMFGDQAEAAEARDIGVNFVDTADVFTQGAAKRIVGQCQAPSALTNLASGWVSVRRPESCAIHV
jgi:aryl-alcohol dehydrogenase-like predicted oxidoreductase